MTLKNSKIFFIPLNAWDVKYLIWLEIASLLAVADLGGGGFKVVHQNPLLKMWVL